MENAKAVPPDPGGRPTPARPRLKPINREQMVLRAIDVEQLIPADHKARAIWALVSQLDLSAYLGDIAAVEGRAGRSAYDPHMLISLWIYAYSEGIGSARQLARRCEEDPALQWLTGLMAINYHTLSSFRSDYGAALQELDIQILGVLSFEGLVDFQQVMQDGTKIKAQASGGSFRRQPTLEKQLEQVRQQLEQVQDPQWEQQQQQRRLQAQQRAAREREARLTEALVQLEQIRATQKDPDPSQTRASTTDPEARIMRQSDGGYAPSYNVQLMTDAKAGIIVGSGVTQAANDFQQLAPALEALAQKTGQQPQQVVADAGYCNQQSVQVAQQKGIELIGPALDPTRESQAVQQKKRGVAPEFYSECFRYDGEQDCYWGPQGCRLDFSAKEKRQQRWRFRYRASAAQCGGCRFKAQCCPGTRGGRSLVRAGETAQMEAFHAKMQTEAARQIYRKRAQVAEFPNAWIKAKLGLRQFSCRGLLKVGREVIWASLTYNIQQWIRLCWRPRVLSAAVPR